MRRYKGTVCLKGYEVKGYKQVCEQSCGSSNTHQCSCKHNTQYWHQHIKQLKNTPKH